MDIKEFNRLASTVNINRHPWETTRARIACYLLQHKGIDCSSVADVGSGDAFVLHYLMQKKTGNNYTAIDHAYTPDIIHTLQANGIGDGIAFFDSLQAALTSRQFDCILLMDIIEHCQDDDAFMKELLQAIQNKNTTQFLITVPAFQSLFSDHDVQLTHYRRYTMKQLTTLCCKHNLQVITTGYFFFSLLPVRLLHLLLEKTRLKKTVKAIDNWQGSHFASKFISFILWLDFRLCYSLSQINIRLPGLSCYCLCQKSAS